MCSWRGDTLPFCAYLGVPEGVSQGEAALGPSDTLTWAYQRASARVKRPSASVLLTSIVLPFAAVRISPGRMPLRKGHGNSVNFNFPGLHAPMGGGGGKYPQAGRD